MGSDHGSPKVARGDSGSPNQKETEMGSLLEDILHNELGANLKTTYGESSLAQKNGRYLVDKHKGGGTKSN